MNATIAVAAADLVVVANGLTAVDGSMAATMAVVPAAGVTADRRTMAEGLTVGATVGRLMVAAMITVDHPMLTAARTAAATITNTTANLV